jgi:hypothetical protein
VSSRVKCRIARIASRLCVSKREPPVHLLHLGLVVNRVARSTVCGLFWLFFGDSSVEEPPCRWRLPDGERTQCSGAVLFCVVLVFSISCVCVIIQLANCVGVFVCVCVCVCGWVCVGGWVCLCGCIYIYMYVYTCMYSPLHTYGRSVRTQHVCTYIPTYTHVQG